MKYLTLGILAHVDAGKTTLSESLLYNTGKLRAPGRVDKGDAYLDTDPIEKERGITIFSKQAVFNLSGVKVTLLDTPGHADFSAETERTLSVLDAAILVLSAVDGVQSHTLTLWHLLKEYGVPTLVFVNKTDRITDNIEAFKENLLKDLKNDLSINMTDFSAFETLDDEFKENVATCEEALMEKYLESGEVEDKDISDLFMSRRIFPVFFGSALKNDGIPEFITGFSRIISSYGLKNSPSQFGARVFKITRDSKEERLTHIKLTGGSLKTRDIIGNEKVAGIRIYDGDRYEQVPEAEAGQTVALTGLYATYPGQGLGGLSDRTKVFLTPVLSYELILPSDCDISKAVSDLKKLSEEQPDLELEYDEDSKAINIRLMGDVQTEILKRRIKERFGYDVDFGESRIIYKETISDTVEGVGHFEPLRHYAEVHLLMEPLEEGEGLVFESKVSEDILDKNWQRLVLTHLREKVHKGVLTGSAITDMRITLVSGKAHIKHTEGGDFRQATYRAVRNGLFQAQSRLLEPYYDFTLEIPTENVGRAMTDLERLFAKDFSPEIAGENTILKGMGPVATLAGYGTEVTAYTSGRGHLSVSFHGYGPCHNEDEVIEKIHYEPERDIKNTPDSVFVSHGSAEIVPWNEVKQRMHLPSYLTPVKELTDEQIRQRAKAKTTETSTFISTDEVDSILQNASSANIKTGSFSHKGIRKKEGTLVNGEEMAIKPAKPPKPKEILPEYMLVDGYNVIFAWEGLKALAADNIDSARGKLLDILSDYRAMKGIELMVVFDAYKLQDHKEEVLDYHNIKVVFTKTAQTADYYIEKFAKENSRKLRITVVTSDGVEQVIVRGNAAIVSSREFEEDVRYTREEFKTTHGVL